MKEKVVIIYSGGMDSFTLLNLVKSQGYEVYALSFNYGQRHMKELEYAAKVCQNLNLHHKIIDVQVVNDLVQGSALTSDIKVPEGHYADESMKLTVVPNRNMIMLSLAVGYAVSIGATKVFYGAHAGDHSIYMDCRPAFVDAMRKVARIANYEPIEIETPFLYIDKGAILKIGLDMGLDYSSTWTCYNGREKACSRCGACIERLESFKTNRKKDPLEYETGKMFRLTTTNSKVDKVQIFNALQGIYNEPCYVETVSNGESGDKKQFNFKIPPGQHPSKSKLQLNLAEKLGFKTFSLIAVPDKAVEKNATR